jgi:hypothetical protein
MDPKEKENEQPKGNETPETPATSADIAGSKVAGVVKKLETRISVLEDNNKTLTQRNTDLESKIGAIAKIPSQVTKGKTLLDDLDEFVFGAKPVAPVVPPNPGANS